MRKTFMQLAWFAAWMFPALWVMLYGEMTQRAFQTTVLYFVANLGWTAMDIRDRIKLVQDGDIHQPKRYP